MLCDCCASGQQRTSQDHKEIKSLNMSLVCRNVHCIAMYSADVGALTPRVLTYRQIASYNDSVPFKCPVKHCCQDT